MKFPGPLGCRSIVHAHTNLQEHTHTHTHTQAHTHTLTYIEHIRHANKFGQLIPNYVDQNSIFFFSSLSYAECAGSLARCPSLSLSRSTATLCNSPHNTWNTMGLGVPCCGS